MCVCVFVQSNLVKHLLREFSELRSSGLFRAAFGASSELGVSENGRLRGLRGGGAPALRLPSKNHAGQCLLHAAWDVHAPNPLGTTGSSPEISRFVEGLLRARKLHEAVCLHSETLGGRYTATCKARSPKAQSLA